MFFIYKKNNNTTKIKMSDVYLDIARQMNVKTSLRADED